MFSGAGSFGGSAQGFDATPAQSAPEATGKKPRQEEKQTCLPVTVRLIEKAVAERTESAGELRFHGTEQSMLIVVGMVEALTRQSASMEFSLNDATGRMKARYYMTSRQPSELEGIEPGTYVCVSASVRTAPEVHLAVTGMRPVRSGDEVSFHMIEVAHAMLRLKRRESEPMVPLSKGVPEMSPMKPVKPVPESVPDAVQKPRLSGSKLRHALLDFSRKEGEGKAEGVNLAAFCKFADPTPKDEVKSALEHLVNKGDLYTTIDEEHFQCI